MTTFQRYSDSWDTDESHPVFTFLGHHDFHGHHDDDNYDCHSHDDDYDSHDDDAECGGDSEDDNSNYIIEAP